jgi:hypothetical protein
MPAVQVSRAEPVSLHQPSEWAMQKAWRFLAQRNWPASLEATLADPLRAKIIRTYARQLDRSWSRTHQRQHDQKRAAAGDLAD